MSAQERDPRQADAIFEELYGYHGPKLPPCPHGHMRFAGDPLIQRIGFGAPAVRYILLGYRTLILDPKAKRPHEMLGDRGGVYLATSDLRVSYERYLDDPTGNIAVPTGAVSRLVVIDLDVNGEPGGGQREFWAFLAQHGLPFPPCPVVSTPSGGWHLWLRTPPAVAVPQRLGILPGVDVKGDGGYVVVPPSMLSVPPLLHPGERGIDPMLVSYKWETGCPCTVPPAPPWLLPWIASSPGNGHGHGSGTHSQRSGDPLDLGELRQNGIDPGKRNKELHRAACSAYLRHGTSPSGCAAARSEIDAILARTDRADFGEDEVRTLMASALRWARECEAESEAMKAEVTSFLAAGDGTPGGAQ